MRLSRRIAAVLSALSLWNLALGPGAATCVMAGSDTHPESAAVVERHALGGDRGSVGSASAGLPAHHHDASTEIADSTPRGPGDHGAPGAGVCSSVASCSVAVAAEVSELEVAGVRIRDALMGRCDTRPTSVGTSPEIPPPRA